ncbi:MAG: hypothetical protein ACTS22_08355 [Phycisphaerales bacterium]
MSGAPGDRRLPSLIDGLATDPAAAPGKTGAQRGRPLRAFIDRQLSTPARAKRFRAITGSAAGLGIGAALVWGLLALMPTPKPDYETDPLDDVLGYTLFTTEFNALPVEERVDLIGQVVKRVEALSAGDGTLLSSFAAGIMGEAREQLEENAATLVIDMWDEYAPGYVAIDDPAEREAYLADAVVGMTRLFERLDGDPTNKTDEEILADARRQAERDRNAFRDPTRGPSTGGVARFFTFMQREVGDRATPHQRARITELTRDMTRYLRGEKIGG